MCASTLNHELRPSLQTVYRAGRVEGSLRLDVPLINLGYDQIHGNAGDGTTTDFVEVESIGMGK